MLITSVPQLVIKYVNMTVEIWEAVYVSHYAGIIAGFKHTHYQHAKLLLFV